MIVVTSKRKSCGDDRSITESEKNKSSQSLEFSSHLPHPSRPVVSLRRVLRAPALLALLSMASPALADDANETVQLEYHAPDECATEPTFLDVVRAHTRHVTFAASGAHRTFEVSIVHERGGFAGSLTSKTHAGGRTRRSFHGQTCDEMTAALALLVALAVDPKAALSPRPPPLPPPAPPPPLPMPAPLPPSTPVAPPAHAVARPPTRHGMRWEPDAGIEAVMATGVAPVVMTGVGLFGGGAAARDGWFSPSVRGGVVVAATGVTGAADSQAEFLWITGEVEACSSRWNVKAFSLWPCLHGEAGAVRGEGTAIAIRQTTTVPWLALGGLARLRWAPGADKRPPHKVVFFGELAVAASAPLAHPTFVFETPRIVVHQPPPALANLAVAAGVTIP
jgi:hypothetical protein